MRRPFSAPVWSKHIRVASVVSTGALLPFFFLEPFARTSNGDPLTLLGGDNDYAPPFVWRWLCYTAFALSCLAVLNSIALYIADWRSAVFPVNLVRYHAGGQPLSVPAHNTAFR